MAHRLTQRANGKAEMAYTGAEPWHHLGQPLEAGADLATWQHAAGMDFEVRAKPVQWEADSGEVMQWEDRTVLYRGDNNHPLGIVAPGYKIFQPAEVFEFFKDLVDSAGFTLETAGTLYGGSRYWALARVGEMAYVHKGDWVGGYVLLTTTADGKGSTEAKLTTIRVVCHNIITAALGAGARGFRMSHRSKFDAARAKAELGVAAGQFTTFMQQARVLAGQKVTDVQAGKLVGDVLLGQGLAAGTDAGAVVHSAGYNKIMALFSGAALGSNLPGVAGTAWGLLNAVTEYVDHHTQRRTLDSRVEGSLWGDGDAAKRAAFAATLALVN